MKEELTMLLNTLALIETKGDGTLKMAMCMQHIQQLIAREDQKTVEENKEV